MEQRDAGPDLAGTDRHGKREAMRRVSRPSISRLHVAGRRRPTASDRADLVVGGTNDGLQLTDIRGAYSAVFPHPSTLTASGAIYETCGAAPPSPPIRTFRVHVRAGRHLATIPCPSAPSNGIIWPSGRAHLAFQSSLTSGARYGCISCVHTPSRNAKCGLQCRGSQMQPRTDRDI